MPEAKLKVILLRHTPNPEETIAMAAKLCYSPVDIESLKGKIESKDQKAFVEKLAKMGHLSPIEHPSFTFAIEGISRACYDKETEILTDKGWKFFKDLTSKDLILTLNSNRIAELQPIKRLISYKYNGYMHHYKSQNVDIMVTPDHNIYLRKYDVRIKSDYHLLQSEKITFNRFYIPKAFVWENTSTSASITIKGFTYERRSKSRTFTKKVSDFTADKETFLKLLAWYLSEGTTTFNAKENSYRIIINQYDLKTHIENRKEIIKIIADLGFTPQIRDKEIRFKSQGLGKFFKDIGSCSNKRIPFDLFKEFNQHYANIFLKTYIKGDGTKEKNGHERIYTTSKVLADQLQILAFLAGYTASIWKDNRVGQERDLKGNRIKNNHICYVVSLSKAKRNREPVIKKDCHLTLKKYNDFVYCVEVLNHTIFVRRNGIAVWCGNCSHQLVRHRLASYSQQSQRYVSESSQQSVVSGQATFDYIIPPSIAEEREAKKAFENFMIEAQRAYDFLVRKLNEKGIKGEAANQDARFVLPNAAETKIIVTMNARELLHFFRQRCCYRAQWEIRAMAEKMLKSVKGVAPVVFAKAGPGCLYAPCPEGEYTCGKIKAVRKKYGVR